jgi:hypothetical protein
VHLNGAAVVWNGSLAGTPTRMGIEGSAAGARTAALASRPLGETLATIAIPTDEYVGVARLVAAGVASRFDLDYAHVDDLQLAMETLVRVALGSGVTPVNVSVETDEAALYVVVGPASSDVLQRRLRDAGEIRTVLERLVDGVIERTVPDRSIALRVDLPAR